jgi:hypothetical protein
VQIDNDSPAPASNFDPTNLNYSFDFSDAAQIGKVFKYKLTATVSPVSGPVSAEHSLNVTVQLDCSSTSLIDRTIDNMSIIVTGSQSQNI